MDITTISESYALQDIQLPPSSLLLDPSNPRIVLETYDNVGYTPKELASSDVQDYILSIIKKDGYRVAELIRGIRTAGFLAGLHEIIVKRVGKTQKYLVLEGNRRLTAIKHLLQEKNTLEPAVLKSLQVLPVKEIIYTDGGPLSEEDIVDILLGQIHIKGPLEWGPIEKAHYLYKSYTRVLRKNLLADGFVYDVSCAREVATLFNYKSSHRVRKELAVYRVYDQLRQDGYKVNPSDYSLINLAVENRMLNGGYFELNTDTLLFSETGLEKFSNLCIGKKCPISNPGDFRKFADIYKYGTEHEVALVDSSGESVDDVLGKLSRRWDKQQFKIQLEGIKDKLDDLVISEFRETIGEMKLILDIWNTVGDKLLPLADFTDDGMHGSE